MCLNSFCVCALLFNIIFVYLNMCACYMCAPIHLYMYALCINIVFHDYCCVYILCFYVYVFMCLFMLLLLSV